MAIIDKHAERYVDEENVKAEQNTIGCRKIPTNMLPGSYGSL